ncbi:MULTISPECIES: hypothetical protein [Herbiconiux]|uniref:Asparagine synthase n=1 Tax=Herbiconiux flava TaxID=881268 RepID=A0A852SQG3_9MICO|nr:MULTISPECIES: hypothetical protein [Herbiconiux]NQX33387.1 hypothetical protein [Herbiconiux sp. VKM Ac-2851]NYD71087.1 hypothetical protein [Herbiconiux flava]GLK18951.1 hypothetical protein GCM10017602_34330 [Herbiconiux flava]
MARRRAKRPRWLASGAPIAPPEPLSADEIDAAIADGLLIARFSAVLALKNRLIVSALRDDESFDRARAAEAAREVLQELAEEQENNLDHALEVIEEAQSDRGVARHQHDYKARDLELLSARRRVYRDVADSIRRDAADDVAVALLVDDARKRAWEEISREIEARLDQVRATSNLVVDEEYRRHRAERMRRVREFDLWELEDSRALKARRRR